GWSEEEEDEEEEAAAFVSEKAETRAGETFVEGRTMKGEANSDVSESRKIVFSRSLDMSLAWRDFHLRGWGGGRGEKNEKKGGGGERRKKEEKKRGEKNGKEKEGR
ncbi:MAG: hypothetical protein MJ234_03000, partial [bacterium]|nr:hypothetical protein [bacterium]